MFQFIFRHDETVNPELKEVANYKLLCLPGVQDVLITQLFKVRLIKDQFVTTRTLLDFLHHLLMGPGYLFDNLFTGAENDLIKKFLILILPGCTPMKSISLFCATNWAWLTLNWMIFSCTRAITH